MKRWLYILCFGLIGVLFVFAVQVAVVGLLDRDVHQFERNSDERGEHYLKTFFVAGPLFLILWGWVGGVAAHSWRKAMLMLGGILLTTLLCMGVPGLHGPCADIFSYSGSVLGLVGWAVASAVGAWLGRAGAKQSSVRAAT